LCLGRFGCPLIFVEKFPFAAVGTAGDAFTGLVELQVAAGGFAAFLVFGGLGLFFIGLLGFFLACLLVSPEFHFPVGKGLGGRRRGGGFGDVDDPLLLVFTNRRFVGHDGQAVFIFPGIQASGHGSGSGKTKRSHTGKPDCGRKSTGFED